MEVYKYVSILLFCNIVSCQIPTNNESTILDVSELNSTEELRFTFSESAENSTLNVVFGNLFTNLSQLLILDLSYNEIAKLPDETFASFSMLETLNLEGNMLRSIAENDFFGLDGLKKLNLKANRISSIHMRAFSRLTELEEVSLENNYLDFSSGVSPFGFNLGMKKLNFRNNSITAIMEDWIANKVMLEDLDLSYNKINYLEYTDLLTASSALKLNLEHNMISTIDFSYADTVMRYMQEPITDEQPPVTSLNLNGNPIDCDCRIYDFIRHLDRKTDASVIPAMVKIQTDNLTCESPSDLSGLRVDALQPSTFLCRLDSLTTHLKPGVVCPEECTCAYRPWDASLIINCSYKNLTKAPKLDLPKQDAFTQVEVRLDGNLLTVGPEENMGYETVAKLYMAFNKIDRVPWMPPAIEMLELNDNNLSYFDDQVLALFSLPKLASITLGNNPWNCDCLTQQLSSSLMPHFISNQMDKENITCRNGQNFLISLHQSKNHINRLCSNDASLPKQVATVYLSFIVGCFNALFIATGKIVLW